jgi:type I restriction enzyme, S subunit
MNTAWKLLPLNEIGEISRGKSRHRPRNAPHLYEGKYPLIQTGDIQAANFYISTYNQTYSDAGLAQSKLWPKGTLCISIVGSNTAATAILGFDACFPDSVIGFNSYPDISNTKFVKYCLELLRVHMKSISEGAARENLSLEKLLTVKLPIPPLETQTRIANILSAYDDLIENNLRRIKLLEEMAELTYREWFVNFTINGKTLEIDKNTGLPFTWERKKIGDIVNIGRGSSPRPISDQKYFENGTIPWLKIADATSSHIFIHKTKEYVNEYGASFSRKLKKGSLIIAASGTLGFPMFLSVEACIHDGWIYFENIESEIREYLYFTIIHLRAYFEGISYGAAIQNINTGIVKAAPIIIPNNVILNNFKEYAGTIFKTIENLQNQNRLLKESRDILLPRLMSGELEV